MEQLDQIIILPSLNFSSSMKKIILRPWPSEINLEDFPIFVSLIVSYFDRFKKNWKIYTRREKINRLPDFFQHFSSSPTVRFLDGGGDFNGKNCGWRRKKGRKKG